MITVLHLNYPAVPEERLFDVTFRGNVRTASELYELGYYDKVAVVQTDSLNGAWDLTQNFDEAWANHPGVEAFGEGHRSTSVGDLLVVDNSAVFVVAPIGFEPAPIILRSDHKHPPENV